MKLPFLANQYFSRKIGSARNPSRRIEIKNSPQRRPDIVFTLNGNWQSVGHEQNLSMRVAQLMPTPSVGAFQPFNPEADVYLFRKWPQCFELRGEVDCPETELNDQLAFYLLRYLRALLWDESLPLLQGLFPPGQRATIGGYRREYFHHQIPDFQGNPRSDGQENYQLAPLGTLIGPGLSYISIPTTLIFTIPNEFGWSQILPFHGATNQQNDITEIRKKIWSLYTHYNSYNELQDAQRHLEDAIRRKDCTHNPNNSSPVNVDREIKSAIRSAASAIDASLRYYCEEWDVTFPKETVSFDEKVEIVLKKGNKASYRKEDSSNLTDLKYLYRARNSMHQGGCFYNDDSGKRIDSKTIEQARKFLEAAETFIIWIDSLP